MLLQDAIHFFKRVTTETTKKSELKVYERFIQLLSTLTDRAFSPEEIQSIETKLESLNLESNPKNAQTYYKKALHTFEKYLKETFSLIPKGYYTNLGIIFGTFFGLLFGVVFLFTFERSLGIALSLSFGMIIGLIIGIAMDTKAKKENRIL